MAIIRCITAQCAHAAALHPWDNACIYQYLASHCTESSKYRRHLLLRIEALIIYSGSMYFIAARREYTGASLSHQGRHISAPT